MRREVLLADRLEPLPLWRPWPEVLPRELQRLVQLGLAFGRERHADQLPPLLFRCFGGPGRPQSAQECSRPSARRLDNLDLDLVAVGAAKPPITGYDCGIERFGESHIHRVVCRERRAHRPCPPDQVLV